MSYRVYEASEVEALMAPATDTGSGEPEANRLQDTLNRIEQEGYGLVTVTPEGRYVFRAEDPDEPPHKRISNMR
jgi:hypothetical protein